MIRGYQDSQIRCLAYAEDTYDDIAYIDENDELAYADIKAVASSSKMFHSNVWLMPFGNYVHQTKQGKNPSVDNSIGGFLIGYDYNFDDMLFGAAIGYAYDYLSYGSGWGRGSLQEEIVSFYGNYERDYLNINFALWGGLYQLYSNRNGFFSLFSSTSNAHGWIFSPYLEIGLPIPISHRDGYYVEPFLCCDFVNNWQSGFAEKGPSGFNLIIKDHYSSVLRSEVGSSFFQHYDLKRGYFLFKQKLSYVNQMPFHFSPVSTAFIASISSFPIAIGSTHTQNLGAIELSGTYVPFKSRYPYITLDFQIEEGSSYQSYFGSIEIGKRF